MAEANTTGRSGVERAAILLMTLGEQPAAQVLKYLGAKDVQRLGTAMAQLSSISRTEVSAVLGSFSAELDQQTSLGVDADAYVRSVLEEALGADKANSIVDRILHRSAGDRGLESLKWMEPKAIADMLRFEHPQIASIVLSYLDADQSAAVLCELPANARANIIARVALLDGVHPSALQELNQSLERELAGNNGRKSSGFGGPKVAAEILNLVGAANESTILDELKKIKEGLSEQIQDLMFVFADLATMDDRSMQELLRIIPQDKLIVALKGCDESLRQKIFKNLSERAGQMLKDDMEAKGPVRLSEVEAAQKEILLTARRLADEGQIALAGKGGEEYV